MIYASTAIDYNVEKIVMVLPLSEVPDFDPSNPHPNTYGVSDDVQVGWVKNADGSFSAPVKHLRKTLRTLRQNASKRKIKCNMQAQQ